MNKKIIEIVIICLVLIFLKPTVKAEEFCITTSQELFTALFTAGANGESDHIKIAQGNYIAPASGWKYLELPAENFDLKITGGWFGPPNNACGQDLGGSPFNTVLDANMQGRVLEITPRTNTRIEISSLSFINGALSGAGQNGGGILIESDDDLNHDVLIENCAFTNNSAFGIGGLLIRDTDKAVIRNNLFIFNSAISGKATISITGSDKYGFHITNNTAMFNDGGLSVSLSGTTQAFIANNLLWGNVDKTIDEYDLSITGSGANNSFLYNNNIGVQRGSVPQSQRAGNISVEPIFEAGILNFTPSINSQLVGGGRNSPSIVPVPTPFHLAWGIGVTDFEDNPRRLGDEIDIGALESPHQMFIEIPIFENGFETAQ